MPADFKSSSTSLLKPQILHLFTPATPRNVKLIKETQNKVKNCNHGNQWKNNGIWWCMGLTNNITICPPIMFYCRDCNKRSLSEVKNFMIRLSSGSILLDTCLFIASLKSSFTPLSAPRVEIRRWLWKILMLVSYSKSTQWSYHTCIFA
jgi:hypothetical protein